MRFLEIIAEGDYTEDLRSEIITLLAAVSAEGIEEVDTQNLLTDLEQQGYSVDLQSLLGMLDGLEIVQTASADTIQISTSDVDMMVGADAENIETDRVDTLAKKQSTKDIGEDMNEDAEGLNIGDPVIITGDVDNRGETGEIVDFGRNKAFVVVDLYNSGKASFHSSHVEFNDYADSEEEEQDMRHAMGDPEFDYDEDGYYESVQRIRTLAGIKGNKT